MSEGMRSAVNWIRPKPQPKTRPKVRTNNVLPKPGTLSISTCPLENSATRVPNTSSSCPTKTLRTSAVIRLNKIWAGELAVHGAAAGCRECHRRARRWGLNIRRRGHCRGVSTDIAETIERLQTKTRIDQWRGGIRRAVQRRRDRQPRGR